MCNFFLSLNYNYTMWQSITEKTVEEIILAHFPESIQKYRIHPDSKNNRLKIKF